MATITDRNCSVRYRRRQETSDVLEYIHGGEAGAVFGAWDFISSSSDKDTMDILIGNLKRGRYLQNIVAKAVQDYNKSEESLKQAIALKYNNFLSRRKFSLLCKTQTSVFDATKDIWVPRNMKCVGVDLHVPVNRISNESIEKFVQSLDIGHVNQIPNVPGVTRTVTGLVFMILDLHLRLPSLSHKLTWFNDNINHFIFQFSDDGAPETKTLSMSIGSITLWNLGERVRSREHQYLLHCVSLGEKHEVMSLLWQQHTEEMLLLESSVFTVCGRDCTLEFQPAADMSWQSWAANELNQAATYPSPYANVHKGNMSTMGASIGGEEDHLWKPFTQNIREKHLKLTNDFLSGLPSTMSSENTRKKKLEFMAENGIRQDGPPRIGIFADRLRPDPLHCEINAWQHFLSLAYNESVQRSVFSQFIDILTAPVCVNQHDRQHDNNESTEYVESTIDLSPSISNAEVSSKSMLQEGAQKRYEEVLKKSNMTFCSKGMIPGCGLGYIASKIKEHYDDQSKRFNKLSIRLIGEQAITLARYSYRLVDSLQMPDESKNQELRRIALSKIAEYLRNAGGLFNKIHTNTSEIFQLQEYCQLYFNLMALFFNSDINVTVWTMGYAIPYHSKLLYDSYKVGFGIISLQAKESKHSGLKEELALTNRSNKNTATGKWWQVMRSNYIRTFYLPEHQPSPPSYVSHYKSRVPPHCEFSTSCECGRDLIDDLCIVCTNPQAYSVVKCAQEKHFLPEIIDIMKPVVCKDCSKRFADVLMLAKHVNIQHSGKPHTSRGKSIIPKSLSVSELKKELSARGLSVSGNKQILITRLEGSL